MLLFTASDSLVRPYLALHNWFKLVKLTVSIAIAIDIICVLAPAAACEPISPQALPGFNPQMWLTNALQWIEGLGALAFIGLYIIATVAGARCEYMSSLVPHLALPSLLWSGVMWRGARLLRR